MSEITIRKAREEDIVEMKRLFKETVQKINIADYNEKQTKVWVSAVDNADFLKEQVATQHFFVAAKDDVLYGFASITDEGLIDFVYVHKDHQREGVAQKLYDHLITVAKEKGIKTVTVMASITAKPFFEHLGFTMRSMQMRIREGIRLKNFKMELVLD